MKNLRDFVLAGLLLAIGLVLHYVTPSTGTPVKPDFLLAMLFLCLLTFEDIKVGFVAGIAAGILSGLTTNVPGGFVPNVIDKLITTGVLLIGIRLFRRFINQYVLSIAVPIVGTILSGCVFIGSAILLGVFPQEIFIGAFVTAVLPAMVGNVFLVALLFGALRHTGRLYGRRLHRKDSEAV
ncbi:MAG: tryptophan transporter [Clostridiales bacterium]|nr:tryptophan transporter [Clostridiales bacterium]